MIFKEIKTYLHWGKLFYHLYIFFVIFFTQNKKLFRRENRNIIYLVNVG